MNVLLTGVSGQIGSLLYKHLGERNKVFCVEGRKNFKAKIDAFISTEAIDVIIHCGFNVDFGPMLSSDTESVLNTKFLVRKAHQMNIRVIFLSAAGTRGISFHKKEMNEDNSEFHSLFVDYGKTQYINDKIKCEAFLNLDFDIVLYLTTVYSENINKEVLNQFKKFKERRINLAPPGMTSYLLEKDLVDGIDLVLKNPRPGRYILSSANIYYKNLIKCFNKSSVVLVVPRLAVYIFDLLRLVSLRRFLSFAVLKSSFGYKSYDFSKFVKAYNWKPKNDLQGYVKLICGAK